MSKAFTKETDGNADDGDNNEAADEGLSQLPKGSRNYMTPACAEKLKSELKQLLTVERPEVVRTVAWAASNGDRSENADYIYGKRRLREIDRRIRFLTKRLDAAQVIDPATQNSDRVLFGATVGLTDEDGKKVTYSIVGIDEADPARGLLSWISPMARALLNHVEGDAVTVRTPRGEVEYEIISISYKSLS